MKPRRTLRIALIVLTALLALGIAVPAATESAAELLEKGIYTEVTVGDLTAAIEIYTQVVENAEANRPHVAQAHFRLGLCHLKRGSDTEGRAALGRLIAEFPEQEELVARAREELAAVQPRPPLGPAPWEDGEALEYRIVLPTGRTIGALRLAAESAEVDGVEAWQLEVRRFTITAARSHGVSRVLIDRRTLRPMRSTVRHGMLGNAEATYGPDGVEIRGQKVDTVLDDGTEIYDNEQMMHLMRLLPLEPGYKTRLRTVPTWAPSVIEIGLEVTTTESCPVPAGDFDCFVVQTAIGKPGSDAEIARQTFWYSTGPERYLVKLQAEGVVFELTEIERTEPGAPLTFGLDDFGFSGTLPAGWWSYVHRMPDRKDKALIRLLDPEAATLSAVEVDRCPRGECPPLEKMAEHELAGAERRIEAYTLQQGSWTERTVNGRSTISFAGDYRQDGAPWVQYRHYTLVDDVRLEVIFRTPADRYEELRAAFEAVTQSLQVE